MSLGTFDTEFGAWLRNNEIAQYDTCHTRDLVLTECDWAALAGSASAPRSLVARTVPSLRRQVTALTRPALEWSFTRMLHA